MIPTDEQIRALHERFAPTTEAFELVHAHCLIVCAVAVQLLDGCGPRPRHVHSKTTPPTFVTAATYAARARRFGPATVARFAALAERFGEPDLGPLSRRFGHPVT